MYSVIVTIFVIICLFWDVGYYLRGFVTICFGRLFQKKYKVTDITTYYGMCTTRDVDFLFTHMNNARFVRLLDFARLHFYDRTGMYENLVALKGQALVGANTIRYRRSLGLFSFYKIETRMLCWDDKVIFLEHKFITLKDGFVRAIGLSRTHIIGLDMPTCMAQFPGAETLKEFPPEVTQWQDTLETTSAKLRKKD